MNQVLRLAAVLLLASASVLPAQEKKAPPSEEEVKQILTSLKWRTDAVPVGGDRATINLAPGYRFLDTADMNKVMTRIWQNPSSNDVGMIFPNGTSPLDAQWAVIVEGFKEEGYVKDEDADKLDADKLLKELQDGQKEANEERVKEGYPELEILGWAMKPNYDKEAKKLTWAIDLRRVGGTRHSVNYYVRVLGRRGFLVLNMLGGLDELPQIESAMPKVLGMVNFNDGHRYADFNPKTDKVAAYGIAGLIAAGVGLKLAAKIGIFALFFKKIGIIFAAGWKLIVAGCAIIATWFKKVFGRKDSNSQPQQ